MVEICAQKMATRRNIVTCFIAEKAGPVSFLSCLPCNVGCSFPVYSPEFAPSATCTRTCPSEFNLYPYVIIFNTLNALNSHKKNESKQQGKASETIC